MPRLSKINHNNKRIEVVARHLSTRRDIRKKLKDPKVSYEEKMELRQKLDKLPRMSIEVRVRNRCGLTGHPRAYLRKFNLSRYAFRKLALQGMIPGVTKSSW